MRRARLPALLTPPRLPRRPLRTPRRHRISAVARGHGGVRQELRLSERARDGDRCCGRGYAVVGSAIDVEPAARQRRALNTRSQQTSLRPHLARQTRRDGLRGLRKRRGRHPVHRRLRATRLAGPAAARTACRLCLDRGRHDRKDLAANAFAWPLLLDRRPHRQRQQQDLQRLQLPGQPPTVFYAYGYDKVGPITGLDAC
jgi:hypothetical protein